MQTTFINTKDNTPMNCCRMAKEKLGLLAWPLAEWELCLEQLCTLNFPSGMFTRPRNSTSHTSRVYSAPHPVERDEFTSAQFAECHSLGLKNQAPFYSEWTLKTWHISDTRTYPNVLAKISSLSTNCSTAHAS